MRSAEYNSATNFLARFDRVPRSGSEIAISIAASIASALFGSHSQPPSVFLTMLGAPPTEVETTQGPDAIASIRHNGKASEFEGSMKTSRLPRKPVTSLLKPQNSITSSKPRSCTRSFSCCSRLPPPKKPKTKVVIFAAGQSEGLDQNSIILFRRHSSRAPEYELVPRTSVG